MNKALKEIRADLRQMSEQEAIKLWRWARRAKSHSCSERLIAEIREEACWCDSTGTAYPDRLLEEQTQRKFKYAFKIL